MDKHQEFDHDNQRKRSTYSEVSVDDNSSVSSQNDHHHQHHVRVNEQKLKELAEHAFKEADADGSGEIDLEEMQEVIKKICNQFGVDQPCKEETKEVMNHYDRDQDGLLNMEEFEDFIFELFNVDNYHKNEEVDEKKAKTNNKFMNKIFDQEIPKEELQKKQLEMISKISSGLNLEFNEIMKNIEESKRRLSYGINTKNEKFYTEWNKNLQDGQRSTRRESLTNLRVRVSCDLNYMKDCKVKKQGSVCSVYTTMAPKGN